MCKYVPSRWRHSQVSVCQPWSLSGRDHWAFLQFTSNVSDSLHLVFISDYFFLDVFDLITGSDSVDPGKLDPAAPHLTIIGPSRVHKQGVFVVILGEKRRHLSWIPSTQRETHTHSLALCSVTLEAVQGTVLPLKEGCSAAIPGSGKDWRQIASWESVYSSVSHVCSVQYLPVLDIYYSQTGVYSVDQRRTGTWLLLLSEGMSTPL